MEYLLHILVLVAIYATLAISLNLVVGYTGLVSVTQAAFYGIGAYTAAILMQRLGLNFFPAAALAMAGGALAAALVGSVLSRFRDDYYTLGSIGFNVIVVAVLMNWQSLTRGPLGIAGVARPSLFGFSLASLPAFLLLSLGVLVVVYLVAQFTVRSSFGRALQAIREDEVALQVFGYRASSFKLAVFVMAAAMAAAAGALYASYLGFIDPMTFRLDESVLVLAMIILGGLASLRGSLVGAAVLVVLPEVLRFLGLSPDVAAQARLLIYGLLLVVLMRVRPQGLLGEYRL